MEYLETDAEILAEVRKARSRYDDDRFEDELALVLVATALLDKAPDCPSIPEWGLTYAGRPYRERLKISAAVLTNALAVHDSVWGSPCSL